MIREKVLVGAERGANRQAIDIIDQVLASPQNDNLLTSLLPLLQGLGQEVARLEHKPKKGASVKDHVAKFLQARKVSMTAGNIDVTRYDAYRRELDKFVAWFGPERSIKDVTEDTLEGYYLWLLEQVAERKAFTENPRSLKKGEKEPGYKVSYAKALFATFKMFVNELAEKKVITLPANINSKKFKFRKVHTVPDKFTVEEVRNLLAGCQEYGEKTGLFLLLALNCGMYQNDIAELRQCEVDWEKGTICRYRSKNVERAENGQEVQKVTYRLWPETLSLLQKHREQDGELVFLTERKKPVSSTFRP